jgi:hypothetical protein
MFRKVDAIRFSTLLEVWYGDELLRSEVEDAALEWRVA